VTCEAETGGLAALIHLLGGGETGAVIATLDSSVCEVAAKLAHLGNKPLLTWTCPLVSVVTFTSSRRVIRVVARVRLPIKIECPRVRAGSQEGNSRGSCTAGARDKAASRCCVAFREIIITLAAFH